MNKLTVQFGQTLFPGEAREYTVTPLPYATGRAWRAETMVYLQSFMDIVQAENVGDIFGALSRGEPIDMATGAWVLLLARAGERLITHVGGFPDWVWERLTAYSPAIAADAEWIEHHATDAEILLAFATILAKLVMNKQELHALGVIVRAMQPTPTTAICTA